MPRQQRRPFRLCFLHAVFTENAQPACSITGSMASAGNVFDTAIKRDVRRIAAEVAAGPGNLGGYAGETLGRIGGSFGGHAAAMPDFERPDQALDERPLALRGNIASGDFRQRVPIDHFKDRSRQRTACA